MCAAQQLKHYYDPVDLCAEEWELNDEEIAALDLQPRRWPRKASTWSSLSWDTATAKGGDHSPSRKGLDWRSYLGTLFCLRAL